MTRTETAGGRLAPAQVGLVALFVTALTTSQVTAAKLTGVSWTLPVLDVTPILPAAALAYALTFFASDCYAELYGRRAAQALVNVGFLMNFVLLGLVWVAIAVPTVGPSPVAGDTFRQVLGPSTGVVAGSLLAYLVSQNWDVYAFHRLKEYTDGEHLWLRNIGSTATSQLVDTVVFIGVAFVLFQGVPA
jgi:uncharacterized integral membrane protein (TIGR00697 family)